jgi:hypothetical protein
MELATEREIKELIASVIGNRRERQIKENKSRVAQPCKHCHNNVSAAVTLGVYLKVLERVSVAVSSAGPPLLECRPLTTGGTPVSITFAIPTSVGNLRCFSAAPAVA